MKMLLNVERSRNKFIYLTSCFFFLNRKFKEVKFLQAYPVQFLDSKQTYIDYACFFIWNGRVTPV